MITGSRTRLRRIVATDVDHLFRWESAAAVMRWRGNAAPVPSRAEIARDIDGRIAETARALYLIIETLDGQPIGRLDIEAIDPRHRSAEVMLYVGEPEANGKGYGQDALQTACRYLFHQRGRHRVGLTVLADNVRAIALYERLGFRREGVLRHSLWLDGLPGDEIVMSLLAGELRDDAEMSLASTAPSNR